MTAGADTRWPAGDPNEAEIRAELARKAEEVPCASTIRRGDLERLDGIITLLSGLCSIGLETDLYDDAWNLRNHLVPFVPGDEHYDPEGDADAEEEPDDFEPLRQRLEAHVNATLAIAPAGTGIPHVLAQLAPGWEFEIAPEGNRVTLVRYDPDSPL